jgi:hypothetical protein
MYSLIDIKLSEKLNKLGLIPNIHDFEFDFNSVWHYIPHSIQTKKYNFEKNDHETWLELKMIANTKNGKLITYAFMEEVVVSGYRHSTNFHQQDEYPQNALAKLWIQLKEEGMLDLGLTVIQVK